MNHSGGNVNNGGGYSNVAGGQEIHRKSLLISQFVNLKLLFLKNKALKYKIIITIS